MSNLELLWFAHVMFPSKVLYSPTGAQVAYTNDDADNRISILDANNGAKIQLLRGHTRRINNLTFAPDGTLASGGDDKDVRIWEMGKRHSPLLRRLQGHTYVVYDVKYVPNGTSLASISERCTIFWNVATGVPITRLDACGFNCAFSPDSKYFVNIGAPGQSRDRYLQVWVSSPSSPSSPYTYRLAHSEFISGGRVPGCDSSSIPTFTSDSRTLVTCANDTLAIWNARTGQKLETLPLVGMSLQSVSCSPSGEQIVVCHSKGIERLRLRDYVTQL